MDDTSLEVRRYVRERYAAMSGEERMMIGAQMFDSARSMVLASLLPELSRDERRRAFFKRLYPELNENILGD